MGTLLRTLTVAAAALFRGTRNEVCYDKVGCFENKFPWASLTRPIPLPHGPEDVCTEAIFYNRNVMNLTLPIFPTVSKNLTNLYNPRLNTYILSHGFAVNGYSFHDMAQAILQNKKDANVISINWNKSAELLDYPQAVSDIRVAAAVVKLLIDKLVTIGGRLENFHLIGHSLGAHLLSYVGKSTNGKIGQLTGLDPAGPGFQNWPKKVRFAPNDAILTEALHTNVGQGGIAEPVAKIDYYFNAGLTQPGCLSEALPFKGLQRYSVHMAVVCAHRLAYNFYREALKNPDCLVGRPITGIRVLAGVLNTFDFANGRSIMKDCGKECVRLRLDGPGREFNGSVVVATKKDPPYCLT